MKNSAGIVPWGCARTMSWCGTAWVCSRVASMNAACRLTVAPPSMKSAIGRLTSQFSLDGRQQANGQQRVPTHVEEILVDVDVVDRQQAPPDTCDALLHLSVRRLDLALDMRVIGSRQGISVELSAGCRRKTINTHESGRHHVSREAGLQPLAKVEFGRRWIGRDEISHEPPIPVGIIANCHHRTRDRGMTDQGGLDLTRLDADPPELHLAVESTHVNKASVGTKPGEVPGAIHALAGDEWVGNEPSGCLVIPIHVSIGNAGAADEQLALHAHRDRPQPVVDDIRSDVRDGLADGYESPARDARKRGVNRRFGWPIPVPHLGAPNHEGGGERFGRVCRRR